jgi:hypothetical protein
VCHLTWRSCRTRRQSPCSIKRLAPRAAHLHVRCHVRGHGKIAPFPVAIVARPSWTCTLHDSCAWIPLVGRRSYLPSSRARVPPALHILFSHGGEKEQPSRLDFGYRPCFISSCLLGYDFRDCALSILEISWAVSMTPNPSIQSGRSASQRAMQTPRLRPAADFERSASTSLNVGQQIMEDEQ